MYRQAMPPDYGMYFIFPHVRPLSFWMKNTFIPLDIIFISQDNEIINMADNVQPCRSEPCDLYYSAGPAQYVLEINGGLSQKFGIKPGDRVEVNEF